MSIYRFSRTCFLCAPIIVFVTGCATTGEVEDADLFSIANISRWEQEQREREAKIEQIEQENKDYEAKLDDRIAYRAQLKEEETELRTKLSKQNEQISHYIEVIEQANQENRITLDEMNIIQRKLNIVKSNIERLSDTPQGMTESELGACMKLTETSDDMLTELAKVVEKNFDRQKLDDYISSIK